MTFLSGIFSLDRKWLFLGLKNWIPERNNASGRAACIPGHDFLWWLVQESQYCLIWSWLHVFLITFHQSLPENSCFGANRSLFFPIYFHCHHSLIPKVSLRKRKRCNAARSSHLTAHCRGTERDTWKEDLEQKMGSSSGTGFGSPLQDQYVLVHEKRWF